MFIHFLLTAYWFWLFSCFDYSFIYIYIYIYSYFLILYIDLISDIKYNKYLFINKRVNNKYLITYLFYLMILNVEISISFIKKLANNEYLVIYSF